MRAKTKSVFPPRSSYPRQLLLGASILASVAACRTSGQAAAPFLRERADIFKKATLSGASVVDVDQIDVRRGLAKQGWSLRVKGDVEVYDVEDYLDTLGSHLQGYQCQRGLLTLNCRKTLPEDVWEIRIAPTEASHEVLRVDFEGRAE